MFEAGSVEVSCDHRPPGAGVEQLGNLDIPAVLDPGLLKLRIVRKHESPIGQQPQHGSRINLPAIDHERKRLTVGANDPNLNQANRAIPWFEGTATLALLGRQPRTGRFDVEADDRNALQQRDSLQDLCWRSNHVDACGGRLAWGSRQQIGSDGWRDRSRGLGDRMFFNHCEHLAYLEVTEG